MFWYSGLGWDWGWGGQGGGGSQQTVQWLATFTFLASDVPMQRAFDAVPVTANGSMPEQQEGSHANEEFKLLMQMRSLNCSCN